MGGVRVTAVDRAAVVDVAAQLATAMGLADRVTLEIGDVVTWTIAADTYDHVLLVNVAQYLRDDALRDVLARCRAAIRPGGRLYLVTVVIDPGTPGHAANWGSAVEMYLNSSVDQRDAEAVVQLLAEAGWTDVRRAGPIGFLAR